MNSGHAIAYKVVYHGNLWFQPSHYIEVILVVWHSDTQHPHRIIVQT